VHGLDYPFYEFSQMADKSIFFTKNAANKRPPAPAPAAITMSVSAPPADITPKKPPQMTLSGGLASPIRSAPHSIVPAAGANAGPGAGLGQGSLGSLDDHGSVASALTHGTARGLAPAAGTGTAAGADKGRAESPTKVPPVEKEKKKSRLQALLHPPKPAPTPTPAAAPAAAPASAAATPAASAEGSGVVVNSGDVGGSAAPETALAAAAAPTAAAAGKSGKAGTNTLAADDKVAVRPSHVVWPLQRFNQPRCPAQRVINRSFIPNAVPRQAKESAATMLHDILYSSAVATKRALANRAKAEAAEAARKEGTTFVFFFCGRASFLRTFLAV